MRSDLPHRRWHSAISAAHISGGVLMLIAFIGLSASACDIPVSQWALQNWQADSYEMVIYYRGTLSNAAQADIAYCKEQTEQNGAFANVVLRLVDLDKEPQEQEPAIAQLPWITLSYPLSHSNRSIIWEGSFNRENIDTLLNSAIRSVLVDNLIRGDTAVWIFLASNDQSKNHPPLKILQDTLLLMEQETYPTIPNQEVQTKRVALKGSPRFSLIELSRNEPRELLLIRMLLGTEPDLMELDEPMAFPVFGRGRVLHALVGAGINEANVRDANLFLASSCSCDVKAQNPGTDLLLIADWTRALNETNSFLEIVAQDSTDNPSTSPETTGMATVVIIAVAAALGIAAVLSAFLILRKAP